MRWAPQDWRPEGLEGTWVAIYVLVEPGAKLPFYVGQTLRPTQRYQQHVGVGGHSDALRRRIGECFERTGAAPEMGILEWCPIWSSYQRERFWIAEARERGCALANHSSRRSRRARHYETIPL